MNLALRRSGFDAGEDAGFAPPEVMGIGPPVCASWDHSCQRSALNLPDRCSGLKRAITETACSSI